MSEVTNADVLAAVLRVESALGQRLTAVEVEVHTLIGNGQPGRIAKLEAKVSTLESYLWRALGAMGAIGASGTFIWAIVKWGIAH